MQGPVERTCLLKFLGQLVHLCSPPERLFRGPCRKRSADISEAIDKSKIIACHPKESPQFGRLLRSIDRHNLLDLLANPNSRGTNHMPEKINFRVYKLTFRYLELEVVVLDSV